MSATVELQDVPVRDIDLYDIDVLRDPDGYHKALHETTSVVVIKPLGVDTVGRYTEARNVMSYWPCFCPSGVVGILDTHMHCDFRIPTKLVETDPPEHAPVHRKLEATAKGQLDAIATSRQRVNS